MKPLLTVVVPVYNRSHLIERTLNSIAASDCRDFVLKVVDNASTDESLAVCRQWAKRNAPACEISIEVLEEPKAGAPYARNRGLAGCDTPYIYFFDSDDICSKDFIGDATEALANGDADILFAPVQMQAGGRLKVRDYVEGGGITEQLGCSMFSTHSMVFRTEWLRDIGGWREDLTVWQDWELGVRALIRRARIKWMTAHPYHRIAIHDDSITGSSMGQTLEGTLHAMRCVTEEIRNAATISSGEKDKCMLALYFRAMIMAGKLSGEGNARGTQAYRRLAAEVMPNPGFKASAAGRFLYTYTAHGGRGAWRLASLIIGK
ncbi:MAG: glycosyltransferase family 2 protein [Bacteroidaceae bacterium]|nr:glycosyltransferase family 2 protein [Bacteroidaceae bacterium]